MTIASPRKGRSSLKMGTSILAIQLLRERTYHEVGYHDRTR